jgi:hypothetical protein
MTSKRYPATETVEEGGIVMRVHRTGRELVVAACDEELLGRELTVGSRKYKVDSSFYGSVRVDPMELISHLSVATIANLLGKRTVGEAIKAGLVEEGATTFLDGVLHAEMVRM